MKINVQPFEKSSTEIDQIDVFEIFDTIQGEGPYAGMPATFIRLAGCNLACEFCDTDYTSKRKKYSIFELMVALKEYPRRHLFVLTGGEPFRQQATVDLVLELARLDFLVQVETNGTLYPDGLDYVYESYAENVCIVCSPKTPSINTDLLPFISCWKYVVQAGQIDHEDGLPLKSVGPQYGRVYRPAPGDNRDVYVQPLDSQNAEKNRLNIEAAVSSCLRFNYRLCLQIHKIVNLP